MFGYETSYFTKKNISRPARTYRPVRHQQCDGHVWLLTEIETDALAFVKLMPVLTRNVRHYVIPLRAYYNVFKT